MWYKIKTFLFFISKSTFHRKNQSNFISEIRKNILDTKTPSNFTIYKRYKQKLIENKDKIIITDFGAGSYIFNSNLRPINKIAKHAGISNNRAKQLMNLTNYFNTKSILEIGTSLGLASTAMSLGNPKAEIFTLEGCKETAKVAQNQFKEFGFENINLIVGNFKDTLHKTIENKQFDLIFFDGNHQKKATLEYFHICLNTATNNSIFIFDDIYWSKEMQEAWHEIKNHPKVTTTIDIFQWGIVFFKNDLPKMTYTIKA